MNDPTNELCGITIDITPLYSGPNVKEKCQSLLWEKDEINNKFKKVLEDAGVQHMTLLINREITLPSYLRILSDASGYRDIDEGTPLEVFSLELDFYGDEAMEEEVSNIVMEDSTGRTICKHIKAELSQYVAKMLPDTNLRWKVEIGEWRQQ